MSLSLVIVIVEKMRSDEILCLAANVTDMTCHRQVTLSPMLATTCLWWGHKFLVSGCRSAYVRYIGISMYVDISTFGD